MTALQALERENAKRMAAVEALRRELADLSDRIIIGTNLLRIAERRLEVARIALEAARELDGGVTADGRPVRGRAG
jgi:ABC-type phosphate transport system auxiliary subunit